MVLPSTKLGYTLGIKRDRDVISPRERLRASPFKGRRRTRMAGDKRVDLLAKEGQLPDFLSGLKLDEEGNFLIDEDKESETYGEFIKDEDSRIYAKGDYVPTRFASKLPALRIPSKFSNLGGIPIEIEEDEENG